MLTDLQTPGQRIRFLRKAKGWSQETLAKRTGFSQVAICHWETGRRMPGRGAQILLAEALETTRTFLFGEQAA